MIPSCDESFIYLNFVDFSAYLSCFWLHHSESSGYISYSLGGSGYVVEFNFNPHIPIFTFPLSPIMVLNCGCNRSFVILWEILDKADATTIAVAESKNLDVVAEIMVVVFFLKSPENLENVISEFWLIIHLFMWQ